MNPSRTLSLSWGLIESTNIVFTKIIEFIDERSRSKIQFLKKKEWPKLKEFFDPDQIEVTYGG